MNLLITGGAGFIGSKFAELCLKEGHRVVIIDDLNSILYSGQIKRERISKLKENFEFEFIQNTILEHNHSKSLHEFETVINFAALPGQLLSWAELTKYTMANLVGVGSLIDNYVLNKQVKFIQLSTSSVYGKNAIGSEIEITKPYSPYGVTKKAAEDLINAYHQNFGIDYLILRPFSVFGTGQRPDMAVHKFLVKIKNEEVIDIYGDGQQLRSMTPVTNIANAVLNAVQTKSDSLPTRIFNLAGDDSISVNELIEICEDVVGKSAKRNYVKTPAGDQLITSGDSSLAKEFLKFDATVNVKNIIEDQYTSIVKNQY